MFIGWTGAEAETPILWPPHVKSWLIGKDPDAGRDWGQEEKGTTEDEMAGWHHRLDGHEFEWTPGVGDGQGDLVCCDSWGRKESDTAERLSWTELKVIYGDFKLLFQCSWKLDERSYWSLFLDKELFWIGSTFWICFFLPTLIIISSNKKNVANLFRDVQILGFK